MAKKNQEAGQDVQEQVSEALNTALNRAEANFLISKTDDYDLSDEFVETLKELSEKSQKAATGFTNVITCLAIKAAMPNVDMRYHQTQIQTQTDRPAGFNFRGVSERTVAPWLTDHTFESAQSRSPTQNF